MLPASSSQSGVDNRRSHFRVLQTPTAVLLPPVVLLKRAVTPVAVFCIPSVLLKSALAPVAGVGCRWCC